MKKFPTLRHRTAAVLLLALAGSALRYGGLGGARYAFTDRGLDVAARPGVSVGAFTPLEDDPIVLPVIGVEWKPSGRWDVNLGIPETGIKCHATDELDFFLRGAFEFNDYRLSGDGALDGALFRDDGIGFALGTTRRPSASVGVRRTRPRRRRDVQPKRHHRRPRRR